MQNFMKTIINAVQTWTRRKIKDSTADWNQNDENADNYIKNKPDVALISDLEAFGGDVAVALEEMGNNIDNVQSVAENAQTTADSKMNAANPVGTGSFSMNRKSGTAVGSYSHAEGYNTTASNAYSHAEGSYTTASGQGSHAEGYNTTASGADSHAEGNNTTASGARSHAEGNATGATRASQNVIGEYNIRDTFGNGSSVRGKYVHIVGNGSNKGFSNAHTLDWDGTAWYQGDVYVGSTSGTNKDDGSKKLATEEFVLNNSGNVQICIHRWEEND